MRKSKSVDGKTAKSGAKEKINYFFKETFRPHTKEEYAEVFTRGLGKNCNDAVVRKLPWLYVRVFALNVILFAVLAFSFRIARYTSDYVTAILFGGLLFNIPLLVLFYELYPKRDLSLLKLVAVLLIGGVVATVLITLGYEYIYSAPDESNVWISTLWVGFWEELAKGAVAIAAIAILRKKNPLFCFLIGFAVGTGYSFFEDLGYIYTLSRYYGTAWLVLTSVGRGLSCVCSHAPWTAMICWAYGKFKKPFINFRFWLIAVGMMALHYFADVPFFDDNLNILRGVTVGWAIEAAVVIAIFVAVFFALKNSFKDVYSDGKPAYPQAGAISKRARLSQAANVTAVLCAVALSAFAFAGCCVTIGKIRVYDKIYDDAEFVAYAQEELSLQVDLKREFDANSENYSYFVSDGVLKGATQKAEEGGYAYYYIYQFDEEGVPTLQSVGANVDGTLYYLNQLIIYEDTYSFYYGYPSYYEPVDDSVFVGADSDEEGEDEPPPDTEEPEEEPRVPLKVISYFNIAEGRYLYSEEEECVLIYTDKTVTTGLEAVYVLAALAGATLIGGSAAFITLKIKARRNKDA